MFISFIYSLLNLVSLIILQFSNCQYLNVLRKELQRLKMKFEKKKKECNVSLFRSLNKEK